MPNKNSTWNLALNFIQEKFQNIKHLTFTHEEQLNTIMMTPP